MANETYALFDTTEGSFKVKLFADKAPNTVQNFTDLAEGKKTGKPFYDGLIFHRVIPDFMIQGGCPQGTGTGGPGYTIRAEFNATPHVAGVLSMARTNDPNSGGSQFFICLGTHAYLDRQYTAFGRTADAASMEVVRKIGQLPTDANDRPRQAATIETVTVIARPKG